MNLLAKYTLEYVFYNSRIIVLHTDTFRDQNEDIHINKKKEKHQIHPLVTIINKN